MKLNKDQFNEWLIALYERKYKKGKEELQTKRNTYCCLGVGCEMFIPKSKQRFRADKSGKLFGGLPQDQPHAPKWLININGDFQDKTGISLANLNDEGVNSNGRQLEPFTHYEIATLLDLVYNYKALN